MVSSNHKVLPLGKHKIETSPEHCEKVHKGNQESRAIGNLYCELFHKGNRESGNAGNWQSGILGNQESQGMYRQSGNGGNRQSLGILWQSGNSGNLLAIWQS